MAHFKLVLVWPPTGFPDRSWSDDDDPEEDAFVRSARSVTELYSEGLAALGIEGRCSELRFLVGHDPAATDVTVRVSTRRPEGFEFAGASLPTGVAALPIPERQRLVLDVIHGAVLRLAEARGWDLQELDAVRRHVLDRGFEFRWDGPYKSSPDRRHRARARYRLTDTGYGRAHIEVVDRDGSVVTESGDALAFSTLEGFKRSARTLRWDGGRLVQLVPYAGLSSSAQQGLVRVEQGEAGWTWYADDGANAGTRAAASHPDLPATGTLRPSVVVHVSGAASGGR